MTIVAYTGLPGHGKSYGVVENVIAPALQQKRQVFTNIPLNYDVCIDRYQIAPIPFTTQDIIDNPNWWTEVFVPGALIVIDELWRLWPSGLKANNARQQDKEFLAEHRHLVGDDGKSTEVIFVTQDLSQIAAFAKALVENTFRVTKLSKMGLDNRFRVDVYFGPVTGVSPPISKRDREILGKFKPEIFELYKSHTKSESGAAGDETRTDNRFRAFGGLSIKLGVLAVCFGIYFFALAFNKVTDSYLPDETEQLPITPVSALDAVKQTPIIVYRFLSKADLVEIVFNMGTYPNILYKFRVTIDDSETTLTDIELSSLGYTIEPINDCLVKLTGSDWSGIAMCRPQKEKKTWSESLVNEGSI